MLPCASVVKNLPAMQETQVRSLGREDPLQEGMETHSPFQKSLAGCSPRGHEESDTTEVTKQKQQYKHQIQNT